MDYDELEKAYKALNRILESTNLTCTQLEKDNLALKGINAVLEAEKKQWEQSKVLQAQIISQQLGSSDGVVKKLEEEIIELKTEIKRLKNASND